MLSHIYSTIDRTQMIWAIGIYVFCLSHLIVHYFIQEKEQAIRIWRYLCLVPLLLSIIHFLLYGSLAYETFSMFFVLYAPSVMMLIPMVFGKRRIEYYISSSFVAILALVAIAYFLMHSMTFLNLSRYSYTEAFTKMTEEMDEHYISKEWKQVDFNALKEKYLPRVQEAENVDDSEAFREIVREFSHELNDGHVYTNESVAHKYSEYGFSLIRLEDGTVETVGVNGNARLHGLLDYMKVLKINNLPVDKAIDEMPSFEGIAVEENEKILSPLYFPAVSRGPIVLTVSQEGQKPLDITIPMDLTSYSTPAASFFQALWHFEGYESGLKTEEDDKNLFAKMLVDDIGYLRLHEESTNNLTDNIAYLTQEHKALREDTRKQLQLLRNAGMKKLIIDVRNNTGGMMCASTSIASLFTTDEKVIGYYGKRVNGEYVQQAPITVQADGEFANLDIIVLTNFNCTSAGDVFVYAMSELPNVTVAGITEPSGSAQETGGCIVLPEDVILYYPIGLCMDTEGNPLIDTDNTRKSRNTLDVRIPLTQSAVEYIYDSNVDYETEWCVDYFLNH